MDSLTDVRLLSIPTHIAIDIFENDFEYAKLIAKASANNLFKVNNILEVQRLKNQASKVKSVLYFLFSLSDHEFITITTMQLSEFIAISRSTATKVLKELEAQELIKISYGKIEKGVNWDEEWTPFGQQVFTLN
ncbi:Crp/Fnr family transcriptional regulator [Thaumasiovibrio subtropicus]|uniref:Crp/Fnr family transcriptional regulator n=2 Tax=Thaumasiovibrio subtropicus TaxID=1891207 RepID=UPI001C84ACB8|nr:MarR family transcriptional regulator [Thaumasiovibrio subtropicus]